jgi:hypothetical protein
MKVINTNCSWCNKPMRAKLWTNYDGDKVYWACCSDECQSACNRYEEEQRRLKKEAKETPIYLYKRVIRQANKLKKALMGDEYRYTKRGNLVSKGQFLGILKREFMTDDGLGFSSNKILEWQQQRQRDWREQYFIQDPVTEEIRDLLLKWMKRKRYTHIFK